MSAKEQIVTLLKVCGTASRDDMYTLIGAERTCIAMAIHRLLATGEIKRVKFGVYRLADHPEAPAPVHASVKHSESFITPIPKHRLMAGR